MEVTSRDMGPERVLPNSEDELGEEERPAEAGVLPAGGAMWPDMEEGGGSMEVDGEEEDEEVNSGGYFYQPLNQEPSEQQEDGGGVEEPPHADTLQEVQHRIEVMGLHLPEPPPPDSDDEDDPEMAAAQRSRASIPMDPDHVELVKRTMAAVALPSLGVPPWAREISDDQWKDMVRHTLESTTALRLPRRSNLP